MGQAQRFEGVIEESFTAATSAVHHFDEESNSQARAGHDQRSDFVDFINFIYIIDFIFGTLF